jgi:membrane-associated phospholipid phosphatase
MDGFFITKMNQEIKKKSIGTLWKALFERSIVKKKFFAALLLLLPMLAFLPYFFKYIENRNGCVLNDPILNLLPAQDVSVIIFSIIWSLSILMLVKAIQNPVLFVTFVTAFTLLTLSRIISIYFVPLNPPVGLIELKDPLSNFFYGNTFITKDLFYSGHTATMFLMYLCFDNKLLKAIALIATFLVGFLVMLQHVHYSLDVLAAPFSVYVIFRLAKWWLKGI